MNAVNTTGSKTDNYFIVADGVWGMKDIMVNIYMICNPEDKSWVLVDTGLKTANSKIKEMAAHLFGKGAKPKAILLTHGHFDHVGSLKALAEEWEVPVYAHKLEVPYLTGKSSYPPPDPTVGGGLMALLAWTYPASPIDITENLVLLRPDGTVPFLPDWEYIHTPGHAPGHVSFYRKSDGVLIAGDAFVTTKQESLTSVVLQTKKLSGPPKYFTYDWAQAKKSVEQLAKLQPSIIATGHGQPMNGKFMTQSLNSLSENFNKEAVPLHGRYVHSPAVADETGVTYVPPRKFLKKKNVTGIAIAAGIILLGVVVYAGLSGKKRKEWVL